MNEKEKKALENLSEKLKPTQKTIEGFQEVVKKLAENLKGIEGFTPLPELPENIATHNKVVQSFQNAIDNSGLKKALEGLKQHSDNIQKPLKPVARNIAKQSGKPAKGAKSFGPTLLDIHKYYDQQIKPKYHEFEGLTFNDVLMKSLSKHDNVLVGIKTIDLTFVQDTSIEFYKDIEFINEAKDEIRDIVVEKYEQLRKKERKLQKEFVATKGKVKTIRLELYKTRVSIDIWEFYIGTYFDWLAANFLRLQIAGPNQNQQNEVSETPVKPSASQKEKTNYSIMQWAIYYAVLQEIGVEKFFENYSGKKLAAIKFVCKKHGIISTKNFQIKYNSISGKKRKNRISAERLADLQIVLIMVKDHPKAVELIQSEINMINGIL